MGDTIWTARNAAEYAVEALEGCGETPAEYDIDAIVRELYRQTGTHDLRTIDTELFWSVVWANQRPKIHPYFVAKAREVFHAAGGNPDLSDRLAAWAQEQRNREQRPLGDVKSTHYRAHGVIVAENGELIAETIHTYPRVGAGAAYVLHALVPEAEPMVGQEIGFAVSGAVRHVGQRAIHVKTSQVCYGAGKFVKKV